MLNTLRFGYPILLIALGVAGFIEVTRIPGTQPFISLAVGALAGIGIAMLVLEKY